MNGSVPSNALEGRVEVCLNNTYGTVCDDLWNDQAARVTCGGLNGENATSGSHFQCMFGQYLNRGGTYP